VLSLFPLRAGAQAQGRDQSQQEAPADSGQATKPAQVTYENGQLTIIAENSPLSDILRQLHALMAVEVDFGGSAGGERMWARLGPGPPRKVVSELLSYTELNYVIQASSTDADGIQSVSLDERAKGGPLGAADAPASGDRMVTRLGANKDTGPARAEENRLAEAAADETATTTPAANQLAGTNQTAATTQAATDASADAAAPPAEADPNKPPATRNSSQMMQQLQSMYETRRKMLEQQSQQNVPSSQ